MTQQTTGLFAYTPATTPVQTPEMAELAAAAAVEPILKRWRHRCSSGLIDENGKVRNVFTKTPTEADNNVTRVIEEMNDVPEAMEEFAAALEARQKLFLMTGNQISMPVQNARLLEETSLDGCGFRLERHTSAVTDWDDERQLAEIYYDEINNLVKKVTGARYTFSNNHLLRQSEPLLGGNGPLAHLMAQSRGPVTNPHNDFTESYGEAIIKTVESGGIPHTQTFGLTNAIIEAGVTADELRSSRILIINTWRSVGDEPLRRYPLALADRRTVSNECLRSGLIGKVPSGEPRGGIDVYSAIHEAKHQWYYYPEMTPDEVLLWKGYDSAEVPAIPTLHASFDDPAAPPDAGERKSVEVRVLCVLPA